MKKLKLFTVILLLCFFVSFQSDAATPVRKTDVNTARSGACMVSVKGTFLKANKQAILKRINAIRYEACKEGIINENTGKPLTLADYVPVKWSRKLQELAETRAAEASVLPGNHNRLNGWLCPHTIVEGNTTYAIHSGKICPTNNYISEASECLAGEGSSISSGEKYMAKTQMTYMEAINLWYEEKSFRGGHYMEMINNDMDYIGMGIFQSDEISTSLNDMNYGYHTVEATGALELTNSSSAEAREDGFLKKLRDESETGLQGEYIQILELKSSRIKGFYMNKTGKQTMDVGDKKSLYTVYHVDNDQKYYSVVRYVGPITWSSSNPAVVSVDKNGKVSAVGSGEATITAKNGNGKTAKCTFKIRNNRTKKTSVRSTGKTKVSRIKINGVSKNIAAGSKIRLTAKVSPKTASNKKVKWATSNKKYATVTQTGLVKINKKAGGKTVRITATAKDGTGKKAVWNIRIMRGSVYGIVVKGYRKSLKVNHTMQMQAVAKVTKGTPVNRKLKWTSSNPKYATVTQTGKVRALKAGKGKTVKIVVTSTDGTNKRVVNKIKIK